MEKRGTERRGRMEGERQDRGMVGEREDGEGGGGGGENSHKEKNSKVRPYNFHHQPTPCFLLLFITMYSTCT